MQTAAMWACGRPRAGSGRLRAWLLLVLIPGGDAALDAAGDRRQGDAQGHDHHDRHEHMVGLEGVAVAHDQVAYAAHGGEELSYDHAYQRSSNSQPHAGGNIWQGRWDDDVAPQGTLGRSKRPSHLQQPLIDVPHTLLGIDD